MSRRVVITGLGTVSGLGIGIEPTWQGLLEGKSAITRITIFDPAGFPARIASEVRDMKVSQFVPKRDRKAVKVMARDIECAVVAADQAARDAKLTTRGTINDPPSEGQALSYRQDRVGANIGAGLIATDLQELTEALSTSIDEEKNFDIHKWGKEGMTHLTPLWMLKYLPNMLACHVTIIHDAQGPSNTITCDGASSGLSVGEALRVIQRGQADVSFSGGTESKLNLMAFIRQVYRGILVEGQDESPQVAAKAVRPFSQDGIGSAIGEGGGLVILEALETFALRKEKDGARAYAEVVGFASSQSVYTKSRNSLPDPEGRGLAVAIRNALRDAKISPDQVSVIVPVAMGHQLWDSSELASLKLIFGDRLASIPLVTTKPAFGLTGAGQGGLDCCILAKVLSEQKLPPTMNYLSPMPGIAPARPSVQNANLEYGLTYNYSINGQNAAIVLKRV